MYFVAKISPKNSNHNTSKFVSPHTHLVLFKKKERNGRTTTIRMAKTINQCHLFVAFAIHAKFPVAFSMYLCIVWCYECDFYLGSIRSLFLFLIFHLCCVWVCMLFGVMCDSVGGVLTTQKIQKKNRRNANTKIQFFKKILRNIKSRNTLVCQ